MKLYLSLKMLAPALIVFKISSGLAAEPSPAAALQQCRTSLSSDKRAATVERWSTDPLPHNYRQAAETALRNETVSGWTVHKNSNLTSTVVVHIVDPETEESYFLLLFEDKSLALKNMVSASEFAFSHTEKNGVAGLFFCDEKGPSSEWVWGNGDWR